MLLRFFEYATTEDEKMISKIKSDFIPRMGDYITLTAEEEYRVKEAHINIEDEMADFYCERIV